MHILPKLNYAYDALEPYIDEETMRLHHTKHHQGYIDRLNAALEKFPEWQNKSVEELIKNLTVVPEAIREAVRNHGGGHLNHSFFWEILGPSGAVGEWAPVGRLADELKRRFGDFTVFRKQFTDAGLARFGSGWVWLVTALTGALEIISTPNQDSPLTAGQTPLLGVDLWEHAYYLKYRNRRADYLEAIFKVINWRRVGELFDSLP